MSLHMLCLPVAPRALLACGRAHRLVNDTQSVEQGYLVHSLLARLWGDAAPKPFAVQDPAALGGGAASPDDQRLSVLAYAGDDLVAMRDRARDKGDLQALEAVDWERARGKPMPHLAAGQRVGFCVRVCPTVRIGKRHPRFAHGAELDPYLAMVERALAEAEVAQPYVPVPMLKRQVIAGLQPREAVYDAWLSTRLVGAAIMEEARLVAMRDARLWRRGKPGTGVASTMHGHPRSEFAGRALLGRREAVFEGTLRVRDAALFRKALGSGVGRHRAFGFGMLLLRTARNQG